MSFFPVNSAPILQVKNYITNGKAINNTTGWATYSENQTFTVTIASPAVLTVSSTAGYYVGMPVYLTTTGSMPTNLVNNTTYYVQEVTSGTTFKLAGTLGGAAINTSGSQSGVHTARFSIPRSASVAGSPTLTFTRATSSPLEGPASFLITTTADNLMGEGVEFDFTVDPADFAKVLTISFDYNIASGTYVTGDIACYIIDVTNSTVIQPAGFSIPALGSTLSNRLNATFQTSATGTSYRLVFHRAVTTASAMTMKIDNIVVGPEARVFGAPVTDWVAYVPTFTGFGTVSVTNIQSRRVGDSLEVRGYFQSGTATGTTAAMTLGFQGANGNVVVNSFVGGYSYLGDAKVQSSSTTVFDWSVLSQLTPGVNSVHFGIQTSTANAITPATGSAIVVSGTPYITFNFKTPIQGWSSSLELSSSTDTRVVAARMTGATASITGSYSDVTWTTIASDTHGSMGAINYTIPVSGFYDFIGQLWHGEASNTVGQNVDVQLYNTTTSASILETRYIYQGTSSNSVSVPFAFKAIYLNAGTQVKIQISSAVTSPVIQSSSTRNFLSINRLSGPATIAASETVAASIGLTTAVTPASNAVIKYDTVIQDTHGGYSVSTGLYSVNSPGTYQVTVNAITGTTANVYIKISGVNKGVLCTPIAGAVYSGSAIFKCIAGDTIGIYTNASGTFNATDGTLGFLNRLSIVRVGN